MPGARYDEIASFYDTAVGERTDDNAGTAALLALCGEVHGRRTLDVACGQGRIARELARRGASVVGVDVSAELLRIARDAERADPLGIAYVHADVTTPGLLTGERFDLAVCNFGLSDIDDLDGALVTVRRLLGDRARFVFSILHPCFAGFGPHAPSSWPPTSTYADEGWWLADNPGFRGRVGANHRMVSTYLNALSEAGLGVDEGREPAPLEWPAPGPAGPTYLVVSCSARPG